MFGVGGGLDGACGGAVGDDLEIAAVGLGQIFDFDGGGVVCAEVDGAGSADGAGEDGSAEAVVGFAHGADGGVDLPAVGGDVDAVMAVPCPGLCDEDEARTGVTEALLEELAGVAGDEVGGSGGVAVVDDADVAFVWAGAEVREGGVEVVEDAVVVDEEFGLEGGVSGVFWRAAVGFGVGDREGGGDWRDGDFGYGDVGGSVGGKLRDRAQRCGWVEAFGAVEAVVDGEEYGREGGGGQEGLGWEVAWHGG